jgi:hypothetical protein
MTAVRLRHRDGLEHTAGQCPRGSWRRARRELWQTRVYAVLSRHGGQRVPSAGGSYAGCHDGAAGRPAQITAGAQAHIGSDRIAAVLAARTGYSLLLRWRSMGCLATTPGG